MKNGTLMIHCDLRTEGRPFAARVLHEANVDFRGIIQEETLSFDVRTFQVVHHWAQSAHELASPGTLRSILLLVILEDHPWWFL